MCDGINEFQLRENQLDLQVLDISEKRVNFYEKR